MMSRITLDMNNIVGKIKPMHGGGQPPLVGSKPIDKYFHYLTEAGIPYSRLHDVGGAYGANRFVDIPNLFRDFDADENDPANYDFTFTDVLITALVEAGVEPYFRLGVTIENASYIKTYRTDPPKDYHKWARICEHVIAHYTEGWADGFTYKITYWEIWNEPDNALKGKPSEMWSGTPEELYRLYDVTAKHLKARFPHLKIGGYGSCGFYCLTATPEKLETHPDYTYYNTFFLGFLAYVKEHGSPLDFFSWHSYSSTKNTLIWERYLAERLAEYGLSHIENHLNEWNPYCREFGTAHHAAELAAMMLGMQERTPALLCIYDMRNNTAPYCPLFDIKTKKPIHGYYAMAAFNRLYQLGSQAALTCDTEGLYAVAATDGKHGALMLSNLTGEEQELVIEGADLSGARYYVIDEERLLSWAPHAKTIENNTVVLIEF